MNHTITTSLGSYYYSFLDKESKEKKVTKKSIIEKGLEYYKKYELEKAYKNMGDDKEYLDEMTCNTKYLGNI